MDGDDFVLDLSDADTTQFEAIPADRYNALVWEMSWSKTQGGPNAKMPAGTPYINVQFKIEDEPYVNRRVFNKYFPIAPEGYDADKAAKNKGSFVNFLMAITSQDEATVKASAGNLDFDELQGKPCVVAVSKRQYPENSDPPEYVNDVKGVKAAGSKGDSPASETAPGVV